MGALTQIYVDPAIAGNSGTGVIGDPYGDLQYAFDTVTRDATNGNQFNVKAGTSEIMTAAIVFTTYGTPTATAPVVIRGYTAAADDGGVGVLDGNNSVAIINTTNDFIKFVDMRLTNCGAAAICTMDVNCCLLNCELDTTTGDGAVLGAGSQILNCYFHNIGNIGARTGAGLIAFNTFRNETNDFVAAIQCASNQTVAFNIIDIDGASFGINVATAAGVSLLFNSVYSNAGTGVGIRNATTTANGLNVLNNTVQGFSGVAGKGFHITGQNANIVGYNLAFNNTTNFDITGDVDISPGSNDTAAASPFVNAGADDFDPVAGLFAAYPSYPTTWKNYTDTQQKLIRMAAQYGLLPVRGDMRGGFVN